MRKLSCDLCGRKIDENRELYASIKLCGTTIVSRFEAEKKDREICCECYDKIIKEMEEK